MSATQKDSKIVNLEAKDLPVFCPNPAMPIWSSHPKVYLELNDHGDGKCPYCGTQYHVAGGGGGGH